MIRAALAVGIVVALAGCSGQVAAGDPPPKPKPVTQQQLDQMPEQARRQVSNMDAYARSRAASAQQQAQSARGQ